LSTTTRDAIDAFVDTAHEPAADAHVHSEETQENTSLNRTSQPFPERSQERGRSSYASVLEMLSITLAVMPSPSRDRGPVPLRKFERSDAMYNVTDPKSRNGNSR
jgi:hypothetical protein